MLSELGVRLAPELWLFVSPRRRRELFTVRHDGQASLGHVVQAFGVPLTEVGQLRMNGAPATAADRPPAGVEIDVQPVRRPQRGERFLLDVHLGTLARRLRILGVDVAYRNPAADDELIAAANADRRVLLTQDRGLLMRRALWFGAYVRGAGPAEQLADVLDRFAPVLRPWTRCTRCNGKLTEVAKHEVAAELQPGTRRSYDRFARCTRCAAVYWHGAHTRRLDALVAEACVTRAVGALPIIGRERGGGSRGGYRETRS